MKSTAMLRSFLNKTEFHNKCRLVSPAKSTRVPITKLCFILKDVKAV